MLHIGTCETQFSSLPISFSIFLQTNHCKVVLRTLFPKKKIPAGRSLPIKYIINGLHVEKL